MTLFDMLDCDRISSPPVSFDVAPIKRDKSY
jgi:hypothetical protein